MILLEDSWLQLLLAAGLGVIFTQFAFLGHEASHCQIFESGQANDRSGRVLACALAGISYSWWMNKHNRHRANPNEIGKDPEHRARHRVFSGRERRDPEGRIGLDYQVPSLPILPAAAARRAQLACQSIRSLGSRTPVKGRWIELGMLAARFMIYFGLIFWLLPFGMAWAFIGVQLLSSASTWARPFRRITKACLLSARRPPFMPSCHPRHVIRPRRPRPPSAAGRPAGT